MPGIVIFDTTAIYKVVIEVNAECEFPVAPGWQTEPTKEGEQSVPKAGLHRGFTQKAECDAV